jgi:hypothetical protein
LAELHGTLTENLQAALRSAHRLRGQRIYADTLQFWSELVDLARTKGAGLISFDRPGLSSLADRLESAIQEFRRHQP